MIYEVTLEGRSVQVDVTPAPAGDGWLVRLDGGLPMEVRGHRAGATGWLLDLPDAGRAQRQVALAGDQAFVLHGGVPLRGTVVDPREKALDMVGGAGAGVLTTQMPGAVVRVLVAEGDTVHEGQVVLVVEAMKMENEFKAPCDGTVTSIDVSPGQAVESGATLAVIEPSDA